MFFSYVKQDIFSTAIHKQDVLFPQLYMNKIYIFIFFTVIHVGETYLVDV